jgi:predicted permease
VAWLFGRRPTGDLGEEIRAHIEMEAQANRESGMTSEEAHYAARRRFGNVALAQEKSREMWGWTTVEVLAQDLRYAVRQLRRNPGYTAVAVLALTLGIGVNTAVFTGYETMVGRSVDARNPGEIVNIALVHPSGSGDFLFGYPDYQAYRESLHSFRGLVAFKPERLRVSDVGQRPAGATSGAGFLGLLSLPSTNAEFANVFAVSENYFQILGVEAARGRSFELMSVPELLASPSVLISENYWERRFARDPAVLGRTVRLNRVAVAIVGITPRDFVGASVSAPDFWLPISLEPLVHADENWLHDRENQQFRIYGRLAPGVGIERAQAEVNVLADRLRSLHDPRSDAARPVTALVWPGSPFPLPLKMYRGLMLTILLIMSAAGMVLVIACANVASLQLARGRSRQAELQTRLSLGASRARLIRQLLTESALSGLVAGAVALPFTWALLRVAVAMAAERLGSDATLVFDVTPDVPLFAFVLAISLVAGILFGLVPAMEASRSGLSSNPRGGTSPIRTRRLQDLLLAAQVGLSLVLLIAASMLIRSSMNTLSMETGNESRRVVDVSLQFPEGPEYSADRKAAFVQELRGRLTALPEVVAITSARAPDENSFRTAVLAVDRGTSSARHGQSILHYTYIQASYFQTLGIPLSAGHTFQEHAITRNIRLFSASRQRKSSGPVKIPLAAAFA